MQTTHWLCSSQMISWTGVTESWSVQHCQQCTVIAISISHSSTLSSLTVERFYERPSKVFRCLISSVSTPVIQKLAKGFLVFEIPSAEAIYAKDAQELWVSQNGMVLPFFPGQAHFNFQYSQLLGSPCHPRNTDRFWSYISSWLGTLCIRCTHSSLLNCHFPHLAGGRGLLVLLLIVAAHIS